MLRRATLMLGGMAATLALGTAPSALASSHRAHRARHGDTHHQFRHGTQQGSNVNLSGYCKGGNSGSGSGQYEHNCPAGTYSAWDEEWLQTSLEGDLFEIAGGKLAQSHTTNTVVRALGAKLQSDHAKSYEDGAKLAKQLGIEVPDEPTPSEKWELHVVGEVTGASFDHGYSWLEVEDHKQDIKETKAEIEKGCNTLVRKDAEEELPMLEEHLKLSQQATSQP
jgi:putative membrane protein